MRKQPVNQESPEQKRARELVLRELSKLDISRVAEVGKCVDRAKTFIDMMVLDDGATVSFVVDGRTVWQDISIHLTKEFLMGVPEFRAAFENCRELINLVLSLPSRDEPILVGPFLIWNEELDQAMWKEILRSWSAA